MSQGFEYDLKTNSEFRFQAQLLSLRLSLLDSVRGDETLKTQDTL